MMRRLVSAIAAVGVAVGVMVGSVGSASAYPPGTSMTVTASPRPVTVGSTLTVTARQVRPGCDTFFSVMHYSWTAVASSTGVAVGHLKAPTVPGGYTVFAKTVNCGTDEVAYTRITVAAASAVAGCTVTAPSVVHARHAFTVTVTGCRAGWWLYVEIYKHGSDVIQRALGSTKPVVLHFALSHLGTYTVAVLQDRAIHVAPKRLAVAL